jgi:hypothetical protein
VAVAPEFSCEIRPAASAYSLFKKDITDEVRKELKAAGGDFDVGQFSGVVRDRWAALDSVSREGEIQRFGSSGCCSACPRISREGRQVHGMTVPASARARSTCVDYILYKRAAPIHGGEMKERKARSVCFEGNHSPCTTDLILQQLLREGGGSVERKL